MAGTYGVSRLRYDGQFPVAAQTTAGQTSRVSSMFNLGTFNYILASYPSATCSIQTYVWQVSLAIATS